MRTSIAFAAALVVASTVLGLAAAQTARKGTQTTLSVSPTSSTTGQAVTLTATVTSQTVADKPLGALQFYAGDTLLGVLPLTTDGDRSTVSIDVSNLAVGSHRLAAKYAGHPQFFPSNSLPIIHIVSAR